jgi:hypothetical protein
MQEQIEEVPVLKSPFAEWFPDVVSNPIVVDANNMLREAQENQWTFSLTNEQADSLNVEDVVDFLEAVIEQRQQWLLDNRASSMKFYCWHDKQAGQLRFSMVSDLHDHLPFAGEIVSVSAIDTVVTVWLLSEALTGIELTGLDKAMNEIDSECTCVWSVLLPRN